MALNFPGPYQLRVYYFTTVSSVVRNHVQALNLELTTTPAPGTLFSDMQAVYPLSPTYTDLEDLVDDYVTSMAACFSTSGSTITRVELWAYEPESFDGSFVSAKDYSQNGTSASATQPAAQSIVTMRTDQGGVFKYVLLESVIALNVTDPGTISLAALEGIISKIESGEFPFIGRDGGWPFARIAHYPGQNEKLFKSRYRAS